MTENPDLPPLFSSSRFTWVNDLPPGRNQFVSFFREFDLNSPVPARIHLFADTRFRLFVNEGFVAYGPARFVTQYAEFDTFDLEPLLRSGKNIIRVEVNYYGTSSYQSMPDGLPGFIAAGSAEDDSVSFETPGDWKARVHQAWDAHAPLFSFAQNPAEICDLRILNQELRPDPGIEVHALPEGDCPWTVLRGRSVPYPDYAPLSPKQVLVASPSSGDEWRMIGVTAFHEKFYEVQKNRRKEKCHQAAAWIHSEKAQTVSFLSFWSEVEVNGRGVKMEEVPGRGNCGQYDFPLKEGWNFYSANFAVLTEYWSHLLAWPKAAGLKVQVHPDDDSAPWALSPVRPAGREVYPFSGPDTRLPEEWSADSGDVSRVTPARLTAWDVPAESRVERPLPYADFRECCSITCREAVWSFDFSDQYYGQPEIEVEAPEGTILDVAYDDWKRKDGCVNLYNSNPFTDAADRFVLTGGRQVIQGVNPRGGIYLQCVLRAPEGAGDCALTLHDVRIRSRQTLRGAESAGRLHTGNEVLDWTWNVSLHTLQASTDEAYADCPWRERGSYVGDSLVNFHLHRLISPDLSIARRTFRMMGEGQHRAGERQGQLASVTPAWHRRGHDDFTLIWILCLRDYWAHTGDVSLLEECWDTLLRIWESPVWKENESGLWDVTEDMHLFVDWGIEPVNRSGRSNLILNAFRVGAAKASARIAGLLNKKEEEARFRKESETVSGQLRDQLWMEEERRFRPSLDYASPCLQGQVLALAFGVADREILLASIEPELRKNFEQGIREGQNSGHIELYFFMYLLPVLGEMGQSQLAEEFILEHYSFLKSLGYPTLNECFCRAARGAGSCCHSWSGAPAVYAADYILGLRQQPGKPDQWLLDPRTHAVDSVSGSLPHPRGALSVSWKKEDGKILAEVDAPAGVQITPSEGVVIRGG